MPDIALGDVINSTVVVGNDNFVLNLDRVEAGALVNVFKPGTQPRFWSRPQPVVKLPRPFPALIGRQEEQKCIRAAFQNSSPVALWARNGMGKTSIARHLSHALNGEDASRSIVYLDGMEKGLDDLLQALFDTFFDSASSYTPGTTSIPTALQQVKALVFVDNLNLSGEAIDSLLNAAPGCVFVLISTARIGWQEGEIVALQGLPDNDALALFEKQLGRPLGEADRDAARKICGLLRGAPADVIQVAASTRESGQPIAAALAELSAQPAGDGSPAGFTLGALSDADRKVLALLAAAGEHPVPLELLKTIFRDMDVSQELQRLRDRGLVQSHSPRFSLAGTLAPALAATWSLSTWQDSLLDYSINWLAQQPASEAVEEALGMLLHALRGAAERNDWPRLIRLGRLLERFLIYYKRFQAWYDVLQLILRAARAMADRSTEGWALHELGSRALFQGAFNEARQYLTQALSLRQSIGDRAGISATRHNLDVLNGLVPPRGGDRTGGNGHGPGGGSFLTYGFFGGGALVLLALAILILFDPFGPKSTPTIPPPPPTTVTPSFTPSATLTPSPTEATITPSWTPTPSYTPTRTPTPTWTPTWTPTPTSTDTPAPGLLYDFVANANRAEWLQFVGSIGTPMSFHEAPASPDADTYFKSTGEAYAGWVSRSGVLNGKVQKRILLTYPFIYDVVTGHSFDINFMQVPERSISGTFIVDVPANTTDTYLELEAGFRNTAKADPGPLNFELTADDITVMKEQVNLAGRPSFHYPQLGIRLGPGSHSFRLWVMDTSTSGDPYAVWSILRLWGTVHTAASSGSAPAQATFIQNANCRSGPGTDYKAVASFNAGQTVGIYGRNSDFSNTWWYVEIPGTNDRCWVSLVTAQATGDFEAVPVVSP